MASEKTLQSTIEISGVLSPSLQAAIGKAVNNLASMAEETLESADAATRLVAEMDAQEDILKTLKKAYAGYVASGEDSSEQAKELKKKIKDVSKELGENKEALEEAEEAAKKLGDGLDDAGDDAEKSSEGFTVLKGAIADLAADAISAAVESFKELAFEGDNALATLAAKTGASAEEMKGFEDVMYEVYNANYGENLGQVGEVLSTVIQMTDDLDKASLAKVTKSAIALEDVFGFGTTESIRAANSLMDQFGITSDEAFNLIVQGAQNGLNQNDDLLDVVNEYAVQFKSAGYSADQMFNMLKNGADSGTWSVDKLGDAMKEYNIRMSDGTAAESLMENYKVLGMTKKEAKNLAKSYGVGGEAGSEAMKATLDAILAVEDENKRYQLGVEMFGTMWEDLGEGALTALFNTEGAITSANDAMGQVDAAAYDTLESSLSQLGRTVKSEVVQPFVEKLTPALKDAVDFLNQNVVPAVDWALDNLPTLGIALGGIAAAIVAFKWGKIIGGVNKAIGAFKAFGATLAANPVGLIIIGITALVVAFKYLWDHCEGFRNFWIGLWEKIKEGVSIAVDWIKDCWEKIKAFFTGDNPIAKYFQMGWDNIKIVWDLVVGYFQMIWDNIKLVFSAVSSVLSGDFSGAWEAIKGIFANCGEFFTGVWDGIKQIFSNVATFFGDIFGSAWETVKGVFSAGGEVFGSIKDGIVETFKTVVNSLITGINKVVAVPLEGLNGVLDKISGLSIAGIEPFSWLTWRAPIPEIPQLAAGGFTDGVSIAGEAGTEAVISFDPAYRDKNISIWERAGQLLGAFGRESENPGLISKAGRLLTLDDFSLGSLANGTQTVIYYDFSGFTWSPHFEGGGSDEDDDLMARLKAHEAEFFDWLEEFINAREAACYA